MDITEIKLQVAARGLAALTEASEADFLAWLSGTLQEVGRLHVGASGALRQAGSLRIDMEMVAMARKARVADDTVTITRAELAELADILSRQTGAVMELATGDAVRWLARQKGGQADAGI